MQARTLIEILKKLNDRKFNRQDTKIIKVFEDFTKLHENSTDLIFMDAFKSFVCEKTSRKNFSILDVSDQEFQNFLSHWQLKSAQHIIYMGESSDNKDDPRLRRLEKELNKTLQMSEIFYNHGNTFSDESIESNIVSNDHLQDKNKDLYTKQFDKQIKNRNIRTALVIVAAFIFTPFSLLVTIPLWLRAKRNEPIREIIISDKQLDDAKSKRQAWKKENNIAKEINTNDKPTKVKISKEHTYNDNQQVKYLIDRAAYKRFYLFNDNSAEQLKKDLSVAEYEKSKQESKKIYQEINDENTIHITLKRRI